MREGYTGVGDRVNTLSVAGKYLGDAVKHPQSKEVAHFRQADQVDRPILALPRKAGPELIPEE